MAGRERDARVAYARALEPVRGKRILTVRKSRNPLARAIGYKIKKFYSEVKVDTGYCLLWAFKDNEAAKPSEEYRLIGPNITADVMIDWSEELAINDSQYRACLVVKGSDIKREDGRPIGGELFFFASDSGVVLQIKKAILAMANAARPPDGSCVHGRIMDEGSVVRGSEQSTFKLTREQGLHIMRACARLASLPSVIPNIFGEEAAQADPKAALEFLNTPQTDADDLDGAGIALIARGLMECLRSLTSRPISSKVFTIFCAQAEKCRLKFESQGDAVSHGLLADSEEFALVTINLLRELGSQDAVTVIREITRAVKHIVIDLRGSVSLMECVEVFGPTLVDEFKRHNTRELSWLFASACSKHRDRIFNKAKSMQPSPAPSPGAPPVSILRPSARGSNPSGLNGNSVILRTDHSPQVTLQEQSSSSRDGVSTASERTGQKNAPAVSPLPVRAPDEPSAAFPLSSSLVVDEAELETKERVPASERSAEASFGPALIHPDDYVNIQTEIDSLTRLHEYLRMRLRDEPNSANAGLWRMEMAACEAEITALSPTMFFVASSRNHDAEAPLSPLRQEASGDRMGEDASHAQNQPLGTDSTHDSQGQNGASEESVEFVDRALSLWAESRKETLVGNPEQIADSLIVLKNTLQDVRSLAENVDEFPGVARAQKPLRETALALVSMLEENVSLRVKILSTGGANAMASSSLNSSSSSLIRPNASATNLGATPPASQRKGGGRPPSSPALRYDGVAVVEEEYEI